MEQPLKESMKHRFKKRHMWKQPSEIIFKDDETEFAETGKEVKRKLQYKPHSHPGGRKPRWRAERRRLRKE